MSQTTINNAATTGPTINPLGPLAHEPLPMLFGRQSAAHGGQLTLSEGHLASTALNHTHHRRLSSARAPGPAPASKRKPPAMEMSFMKSIISPSSPG